MAKFFLRIIFLCIGLFLCVKFGDDTVKPVWYRVAGVVVEGRISGFLSGNYNRSGRSQTRPPTFTYPASPDSAALLAGQSDAPPLFSAYALEEKVTVVFPKENPQDAYIFSFQLVSMSALIFLLGAYAILIGVRERA